MKHVYVPSLLVGTIFSAQVDARHEDVFVSNMQTKAQGLT
jgi:hypothetical protein